MKKSLFLLMGAAALALASCGGSAVQDGQEPADYSGYALRIEPVITKVTETDFESGDAIGLTVTREAGVYAANEKLTYNGSAFTGALTWYAEGADEAELTAYYPYAETVPASFTVASDQRSGTSSSDFLAASKSGVLPTANAVSMVFRHQLSRIVINITNNASYTLEGLTLRGSIPTAVIAGDLTATADESASPADIQAYQASGTQYQAIVVPQTVAFTAVVTASGAEMSQRLAGVTLEAGKQYTIDMIVNETDLSVSLSGNVTAWEDGGPIGARTVTFEEHLADKYFLYDETRYSVVQLADGKYWMAQPLAFVPDGKTVSSDPADGSGIWYAYTVDNGAAAPVTDGSAGYLYDWATAVNAPVTADNYASFEGARGICPPGWHLPSRADFLALVGSSVKGANEAAPIEDETAAYYSSDYKSGKITALDEAGFNFSFLGTVFRAGAASAGAYNLSLIDESVSNVAAYYGKHRLNYVLSSTGNAANNTTIQFFALMSTFTSTYPEGRLNIAFASYLSGVEVRCVRDSSE